MIIAQTLVGWAFIYDRYYFCPRIQFLGGTIVIDDVWLALEQLDALWNESQLHRRVQVVIFYFGINMGNKRLNAC